MSCTCTLTHTHTHDASPPAAACSDGGALACCTVLLHGPAGSGKVTAVSAASRRLNLQVLKVRGHRERERAAQSASCFRNVICVCVSLSLQVDCVTLTSDSLASSEVKLAAAFRRSAALQPCLLLLRNLHLLLRPRGGSGGTEDDGRVPAALCQLLSSAPRRFRTKQHTPRDTLAVCQLMVCVLRSVQPL